MTKRRVARKRAQGNRVRAVRESRQLSQEALGAAAGLSRQSVGAIEAGRATPGVDVALRIARALDSDVETLFGAATDGERIATVATAASVTGRVAVAQIAGRWLSYGLEQQGLGYSADALQGKKHGKKLDAELLRPVAECKENVVIMGCAPALGLLADRLNSRSGPGHFLWFVRGSTPSLEALGRRETHIAGVHLVDGETGEANVPDVRRHAWGRSVALITLARWDAGFVVAKGNPTSIRGVDDLARPDVRLAVREAGSGARRLLEREADRVGLGLSAVLPRAVLVGGHLQVGQAIAIGAADVGVATRDAALAFGLDFIAIAEERYDLVIPISDLGDPRLVRMFDMMTSSPLRREFASLGYDLRPCGDRVAEILAA